jgi:glycerophosphoryl diester phosphodiesterase
VVAHRGGNDLRRLRHAETLGITLVEADLHLYRGRVEVRHLKTLGPVPVLWDRWTLANPFARRLLLEELLEEAAPHTELMLDLKGRDLRLSQRLVAALRAAPERRRTSVCSRSWRLLEPFAGEPAVRVVHSVGSAGQLRSLLRFPPASLQGISIHERLLSAQVVEELRRRAELVVSWPVNTIARARELAAWGVHGMISDRPDLALELAGASAAASAAAA